MIRCENCGGEIAEGRDSCPHCGKAVVSGGGGQLVKVAEPREVAPAAVPSFGVRSEERDKSRLVIYAAVAAVALLLLAGLGYLASRPSAEPGEERLEGAIRPGAAEYPGDKLVVDFEPDEDATGGENTLGNYVVTMKPTVRNFTGRTVNGLEFRAAGLDLKGNVIRERTYVSEGEIETNKTASPAIGLNFPNRPAQLRLELTGVRFK
ncbi:MAG: hypothetical protein LC795_01945 [Acidobacteria bacterium]|nr:hypothetical protein [Acidobacteriota bacterium]